MIDHDITSAAGRRIPWQGFAPLSLSEVAERIERRLAWYGLPHSRVRAVEADGGDAAVATVTVSGNGTFRETFDRRTGCVRRRESIMHNAD